MQASAGKQVFKETKEEAAEVYNDNNSSSGYDSAAMGRSNTLDDVAGTGMALTSSASSTSNGHLENSAAFEPEMVPAEHHISLEDDDDDDEEDGRHAFHVSFIILKDGRLQNRSNSREKSIMQYLLNFSEFLYFLLKKSL